MPTISIVLPCYNHGEYVGEAIESVLNQSYKDFELFVFDNGSSDNSWEVINQFNDSRMIKIRLEKNNILDVKKIFIEKSVGTYCAIMHADDIWLEDKLKKQMELFEKNPDAKVCFTWSKFVDEDLKDITEKEGFFEEYNKTTREWWETFDKHENHLSCPSFMCVKDIYIRHFGKLYPYRQIADYYCWMKILCETNLYIVEEALVCQRVHEEGENRNESARTRENILRENIELQKVKYKIINEMPDKVFMENFVENSIWEKGYSHMDVLCRKMMLFVKKGKENPCLNDNPIIFYNEYFDYEEGDKLFYAVLDEKYGFSRNDFFKYETDVNRMGDLFGNRLSRWVKIMNTKIETLDYPKTLTIYGCGQIGKYFSKIIHEYVFVEQFIDRKPKVESFCGIPVRSIDDANYENIDLIVVSASYDFEDIVKTLGKYCNPNTKFITIEDFLDTGEVVENKI